MSNVAEPPPIVSPLVIAGLLLAANEHRPHGLTGPSAQEVLDALGVGRSQAYEYRRVILDGLPDLSRRPGRPTAAPPPQLDVSELSHAVIRFLRQHPGAASDRGDRGWYSDSFRSFVLELREQHQEVDLNSFARAIQVPLGTLEDWLRAKPTPAPQPKEKISEDTTIVSTPQIESVVEAWRGWKGNFSDFVRHVKDELRINHGATWVGSILNSLAGREPHRRRGRKPDADAIRKSFETFFPGAQFVGDGTQLGIKLNGNEYVFNVELLVDAFSTACVGASVRDEEDSKAVTDAFADAVSETGKPPIGLLLDNRTSNHTQEVKDSLGETLLMRATLFRPENKAHVEGAFGLLKQVTPPLEIQGTSEKELAHEFLKIIVEIWARTLNHRPMKGRNNASRAQIFANRKATPEQVDEARKALQERQRQQELAEQRRRARENPITRAILDEALVRLGLDKADGSLRRAIASYPQDMVLAALAIFEGKKAVGSLPADVGARYLLGITRNMTNKREGLAIAEALLRKRLEARDRTLAVLTERLDAIKATSDPLDATINELTSSLKAIDRIFWIDALSKYISGQPQSQLKALVTRAANRIHAVFAMPYRERLEAIQRLFEKVIPLDAV